ncbi:MAG TPA: ATP-dependent DNA ligase [Thermoanaerobaculia bacterium]|nr:ATP-dependent DNA ligase [Thermoanaerobaculia bacterium]
MSAFPKITLSIRPPFPPMEAQRADRIPAGEQWQFEPKWDGFRAIAFRDGSTVAIQSKNGQPLHRYFPELVEGFLSLKAKKFILDGEIVIPVHGRLSFDDLLMRIHPAESRIRKLAESTPANYFAFDILYAKGRALNRQPIEKRRAQLEAFFDAAGEHPLIHLSPATTDRAIGKQWFDKFGVVGLDGVMAKRLGEPYHSGDREGMVKVKHLKTAECVVGGFRYGEGTKVIGSLLLGLYDEEQRLVYVGHTSSIRKTERESLTKKLEALRGNSAFEVRVPGGPSRWASERSGEWEPVKPKLVCEVEYDYFSQGRFRHGSKFLRWRPDKDPKSCTMDQVLPAKSSGSLERLLA